jgi:hypothetical protein
MAVLLLSLTGCLQKPSGNQPFTPVTTNQNRTTYNNIIAGDCLFSVGGNIIMFSGESQSSYSINNDYFTIKSDDGSYGYYTYQIIIPRDNGYISVNSVNYLVSVDALGDGTYNINFIRQ